MTKKINNDGTIKECPFCGEHELEHNINKYNSVTEWHSIKCKPCKASLTGLSLEGVSQRWNQRKGA